MHEEMRSLLNAYLDGELHGRRERELEAHLQTCPDCRSELEQLRQVSKTLQAAPAPRHTPGDQFVAQLVLRLPPRSAATPLSTAGSPAWWLVPAGLLTAWFGLQTVLALTNLVIAANLAGLLGNASTWLAGSQGATFFSLGMRQLGEQAGALRNGLFLLSDASLFAVDQLIPFLWQAAIVFIFWGWLYFWWRRNSLLQSA